MTLTVPPPGAAAANYKKALTLYSAGDAVAATRQAIENLNDAFCPRYIQIKNSLMVGTLVEDEGHSFNYLNLAGEVFQTLAEDIQGGSSEAEQMMDTIDEEIVETTRRREGVDGPVQLAEKAFTIVDYSVLGLAPELDVSAGLRDYVKDALTARDASRAEAAFLRDEMTRVVKLNAETARELAWARVQSVQHSPADTKGGRAAYATLVLKFVLLCCMLVMFFFGRNKGIC